MNKKIIHLIILITLAYLRLSAQVDINPMDTFIIETKEGNSYIGIVKEIEKNKVYEISTKQGVLTIPSTEIKYMKKIEKKDIIAGEYWPESPHSSRYFFSPSGYGLRKGEGYYQNAWIFLNQVSYAFTNNFTAGLGIIPTFLFGGGGYLPYWVTPKFSFPYKNNKGAFGFGTIVFGVLGEPDANFGILYGTNTFGTRDKQLTLGAGLGYNTDNGFSSNPAFTLD